MERQYNDLIGELLEKSGNKDNLNLKGMGKPLPKESLQLDTYQKFQQIAKNSGYLPEWLELQKEISKLVQACTTEAEVEMINEKIKKHNFICPPQMQKYPIHFENLEKAKKVWG